jgi:protein-disulfide isomerase
VGVEVDHTRGPADAPVTLVEFGDFECPYCGAAHPALRELERRMGDALRVVFRHLPLPGRHPRALAAAEAAEAAAAQGRFWEMHDRLFASQRALEPLDLRRHAEELGLDLERYDAAMADHAGAERVARDVESARLSGVSGTPALFLNGKRYDGFYDVESLEDAVRIALEPR